MRYAHKFKLQRDFSSDEWAGVVKDALSLQANLGTLSDPSGLNLMRDPVILEGVSDEHPERIFDSKEERIVFIDASPGISYGAVKGVNFGYFVLNRSTRSPSLLGNACNTARKPYDIMVCATLIAAYDRAPAALSITSHGEPKDWAPAQAFAEHTLGRPLKIPAGVFPAPTPRTIRRGP
ncbi:MULTISPECIES: hypothetical protein [unclassified Thioalkalivibrio]|uniref:hypothetical protein n=1 Tax=unclassified Thioalkalivibrio TaxID=2621013 RepID=UPI00037B033C|nr:MULTISPECIES: hypothetical protein [unclassified Thioalkalivibrio]